MMFEYLLENNGLREAVKDAVPEMKENAIQFIEELIRGKGTVRSNKKFLYQVHVCIYYTSLNLINLFVVMYVRYCSVAVVKRKSNSILLIHHRCVRVCKSKLHVRIQGHDRVH